MKASRSASPTAPRPTRPVPSRTASRPTSSSSRRATTSTCSSTPASSTRSGTVRATTASPPTRSSSSRSATATRSTSRAGQDLVKPGVQVLTPNPFSSGSAKWNILAAYGAQRRLGKTDKQATAYVQKLFQHVVAQDTSGRNATNTFLSGKGDVLITYESEALNSRLNGQNIDYVIPRQSMLIELPIAVLKSSSNKDAANQFIRYVKGDASQDLLAQYGFRPVNKKILAKYESKYPARPGIFKIDDKIFGGWRKADDVWFDPNKGRMAADREGGRRPDLWLARFRPRRFTRRRARRPSEGAPAALSLGFTTAVPVGRGRPADRRARLGVARGRPAPVLVRGDAAGGRRCAQAEHRRRAARLGRQRGGRDDHRLGARARRVPRQERRERDHRPALRPSDDRRRADAARALRAADTGRNQRRLHAHRDRPRAALRDAAVRRADGAAGAARARPRVRGGRTLAGSERVSRLPERRSCRTSSPGILSGVALAFARAVGRDRRARADLRQPAVQDGGRVGLRLQPHPERRPGGCRGRRGRDARDLVRDAARDRRRCASSPRGTNVHRRLGLRVVALGYLRSSCRAARDGVLPRVRPGRRPSLDVAHRPEHHPRVQDHARSSPRSPCR